VCHLIFVQNYGVNVNNTWLCEPNISFSLTEAAAVEATRQVEESLEIIWQVSSSPLDEAGLCNRPEVTETGDLFNPTRHSGTFPIHNIEQLAQIS
jgi:hypothetical protein